MMGVMVDVVRRDDLRQRIGAETATAGRLCEAVTDCELRKRIARISLNIEAVEVYFLDRISHRSAVDEERWLDIANDWLAIHVSVLRGLQYEATVAGAAGAATKVCDS